MPIQIIDRGTAGDTGDKFKIGVALDTCQANDDYLDAKLTSNATIVDTFASLATTPGTAGKIVTIRCHTSGTIGGGPFIDVVGSATNDGGTIINNLVTPGHYWKRINYAFLTFAMFGAQGGGVVDDTAAVNLALATQLYVNGEGKTYAVTGDISLPAVTSIDFAEFKQLSPNNASRRTLTQVNGTSFNLSRVKVNRNGNGVGGSVSSAAGIWIQNCPALRMDNPEVYGNDYGTGIVVVDCNDPVINDPYIHDIKGGSSTGAVLTDDAVQGIWIIRGNNATINKPKVKNLTTEWLGQPATRRFTRGVAFGGIDKADVIAPSIQDIDQGIDITGDENPKNITILGGHITRAASYGVKCANSAQNIRVIGVSTENVGVTAFKVEAPGSVMAQQTSNVKFIGCVAKGTGFPGLGGAAGTVAAFRITKTGTYTSFPNGIEFIHCTADASGQPMEYGFLDDVAFNTANNQNRTIGCRSIGHTTDGFSGFGIASKKYVANRLYPGSYVNSASTNTLAIAANTMYAVKYDVIDPHTFVDLFFAVSVGAAGSIRGGVYTSENGEPGSLIQDFGTTSVAAAGTKQIAHSATYLEPGEYFIVLLSDVAPTLFVAGPAITTLNITGVTVIGAAADNQITRAFAYAALPATFGAPIYTAANFPIVAMR